MNQVFRLLNSQKANESLIDKVPTPFCWPISVFLETTNNCNLFCPLCPTGSGKMSRKKGILSLKTAEQVFEETSDYVEEIVLGFYGEPFLHPKIFSLVKKGKSYNHNIKLFTNLTLTPIEGWRAFIKTGIDRIIVSLDAIDQRTYSSYRVGGNFENVLSNLRLILKIRTEENLATPIIEVQMLALKTNEHQWLQFISLCEEIGVDIVKLKYTNLGNEPTKSLAEQFLPNNTDLHYYDETDKTNILPIFQTKSQDSTCKELYLGPAIIAWNGDYVLCCRDHNRDIHLGSIKDRTIWDFWNGKEMSEIRENMKKPNSRYEMCHKCPALFLQNYSIKRLILNEQIGIEKPYRCETFYPTSLSPNSFRHKDDYWNYRNVEEIEPLSLKKLDVKKREFEIGNIVDYGSYRTFTV